MERKNLVLRHSVPTKTLSFLTLRRMLGALLIEWRRGAAAQDLTVSVTVMGSIRENELHEFRRSGRN